MAVERDGVDPDVWESFLRLQDELRRLWDAENPGDIPGSEAYTFDDDDYCMVDQYREEDGSIVLHFNERAGGNYCGEFFLKPDGKTWYVVEENRNIVLN